MSSLILSSLCLTLFDFIYGRLGSSLREGAALLDREFFALFELAAREFLALRYLRLKLEGTLSRSPPVGCMDKQESSFKEEG